MPEYQTINLSTSLKTRDKLERLCRLIAKESGRSRVPLYEAAHIAIEEALASRRAKK